MKLLHAAVLSTSLWLAACATPPAPSFETPAAAAAPAPQAKPAASAAAVIPTGPLTPIAPADISSQGVTLLQPPADLWERIRRGFAMPDLQSDLVRQHEQWYATRPDYMQRMTERSSKYLFHIVEELERRNMPTELALLPFIESAFNPQAVSSARAAGMWQFMPATGRDFELKQNVFRDDRRDVLASTRAALDYLTRLHNMFGDWHLALAAYNWGEGSVGRAIARNQKTGLGTSYTDLSMPAETRNYVPKLQAVKNIIANPDSFRAELPVIGNHPYFQTVTLTRDMDVELVARLADVSVEDFKALNPSMKRPVILANGTPQILLPWDNATVFRRNFEAHDAGQFASWTAWSAPSTMSVAEAARRVGMSESDLRSVNTIPPRMLIKAGSVLIVPRGAKMNRDVADHIADNGQLNLAPEQVTRRTTVKAGKRDTVQSIARRYRLNAAQVADWNDVGASAAFKPGQRVVVYLPVRSAARVPGRMVHKASTAKGRKGKAAPQRRPARSKRAR
ncbi:transglycosylase SLT domain-containing protein [Ramlibacter sp. RBP-2]|uniref:Transglycosylase SLT domain-containing protein n=1 Tax=Ramlibacter lithotrophicus TaxID=2606681 RepID=A0A7X6DD01_9BURK|nr:transglycosylase SLT domain-containing protein [Ramlibacter lithotrophicus]NKE64894.1 transglycosylase SLT domain-containing protein [Ramlibacter lithotrophicus]